MHDDARGAPPPSEVPDDASIERIVRAGWRPRPSAWRSIREVYRTLGVGGLLWADGWLMLAALCTSLAAALLLGTTGQSHTRTQLIAVAPTLLLTLVALVEGSQLRGPLGEIRGTTRFSAAELTATRMVGFAALGLVYATVCGALAHAVAGGGGAQRSVEPGVDGQAGVWLQLSWALAAVLAAGVLATGLLAAQRRIAVLALPVAWPAVWLAPLALFGPAWDRILAGAAVWLPVAAILFSILAGASQLRALLLHGRIGSLFGPGRAPARSALSRVGRRLAHAAHQ